MEKDEFLGGEYNNIADLMGLNSGGAEELLGRISRLPKEKQAGALRSLLDRKTVFVNENNSRIELEQKFSQLKKEMQEGLLNKRLQLVDTRYYIVKNISAKQSIDVFQGTDNKNVGLANIANQKLEKDNWFLLSAIRMLYAEASATQPPAGGEPMMAGDYGIIPPVIMNGEFELEAGQKKLVGLISNDVFDSRNLHGVQTGYYKLDSTKIIEPQVEIKMPVKFSAASASNCFLKVIFIGTSVVPY